MCLPKAQAMPLCYYVFYSVSPDIDLYRFVSFCYVFGLVKQSWLIIST